MSKNTYEREIGGYSFQMTNDSTIEVWLNTSGEFPDHYIYVRPGSIKNIKDFDTEISYWYMNNVGG